MRGGGARTDLAAFDAEPLVRAIARCRTPVLTGIGHEVDRSIADEVAHTAAKTPTACAALLVERVDAHRRRVEERWATVLAKAQRSIAAHDDRLRGQARHLAAATRGTLAVAHGRLQRAQLRVRRGADGALARSTSATAVARGRVDVGARRALRGADRITADAARQLAHRARHAVAASDRMVDGLDARVRALDPERALARGWSITRRADGTVLRAPDEVSPGDRLSTLLAGGELRSTVDESGALDD